MASNRYAPEGTYGPYQDDDESTTYGVRYDSSYAQHDFYAQQDHGTFGGHDTYGSLLTETYEQPAFTGTYEQPAVTGTFGQQVVTETSAGTDTAAAFDPAAVPSTVFTPRGTAS